MSLNFFSPDEAVAFDMLLEQGWKLEVIEHEEARKRWVVSIRDVMSASYQELPWPDHLWVQWTFLDIPPDGPRYALVRFGSTGELFMHIDRTALHLPWSVRMDMDGIDEFHRSGEIRHFNVFGVTPERPAPHAPGSVPEEQ